MRKILILTDSGANPRTFPSSEKVALEETYPYLIRNEFPNATFWQLSVGNMTTGFILDQAIGYLTEWNPDWIIVHSGLADCRPEAFSEFQKLIIQKLMWGGLRKNIYNPNWIRRRQVFRVTEKRFKRAIKKFKLIFSKSRISWLEIATDQAYEEVRPGVGVRSELFNTILKDVYGGGFLHTSEQLIAHQGFNADGIHLNKKGHAVIAELLLQQFPQLVCLNGDKLTKI